MIFLLFFSPNSFRCVLCITEIHMSTGCLEMSFQFTLGKTAMFLVNETYSNKLSTYVFINLLTGIFLMKRKAFFFKMKLLKVVLTMNQDLHHETKSQM